MESTCSEGVVGSPIRHRAKATLLRAAILGAGMFVLKVDLDGGAERFRPTRQHLPRRPRRAQQRQPFVQPGRAEFAAVPAESIDYAVMEHCVGAGVDIRMVALDAGWSDLGAWDAVW
jgi:mannose-1-phosphate guanylyltransferase/mannose-6-phosphate isomerase